MNIRDGDGVRPTKDDLFNVGMDLNKVSEEKEQASRSKHLQVQQYDVWYLQRQSQPCLHTLMLLRWCLLDMTGGPSLRREI